MPAQVAIRWEANIRAIYLKLIEHGKKPLVAIVAVMRKLLHSNLRNAFAIKTDIINRNAITQHEANLNRAVRRGEYQRLGRLATCCNRDECHG